MVSCILIKIIPSKTFVEEIDENQQYSTSNIRLIFEMISFHMFPLSSHL